MKWLLTLFLALSASAQLPVIPSGFNFPPTASGQIPLLYGPAEWLDYLDQTNGLGTTNWIDRIQGLSWTTGNATAHPTNTVNGVWFWGNLVQLTNKPGLNMGTNWTVFTSFTYTNLGPGGGFGIEGPLWGNGASGQGIWSVFLNTPSARPDYVNSAQTISQLGSANNFWLRFTDWTVVSSNNANGTGAVFCYTNGAIAGNNVAGRDQGNFFLENLGWNPSFSDGNTYLVGAIRHVIAYTNILTPLQISNLHYWRTNLDGSAP